MTDGYPDENDIAWLKAVLSHSDFMRGAQALTELLFETGYAHCKWRGRPSNVTGLEVATGGWSGCEEIIDAASGTVWWTIFWQSTHRGGLHVFGVESVSRHYQTADKEKQE
jgi:hypothetical protein